MDIGFSMHNDNFCYHQAWSQRLKVSRQDQDLKVQEYKTKTRRTTYS